MNKLLPFCLASAALCCAQTLRAETYTADDFVGNDKICTQLFYGSELVDCRPQDYGWGTFERVEGYDNKIRLTSFKNEGPVTFTVYGDKLYLDDTETTSGAQCGDAYLRTVELNTASPALSSKVYTFFIDKPNTMYVGNISRNGDGLVVTFDSDYLSFRKRTSDAVNVGNYANFKNDFFNTFKKCELYIRKTDNATFAVDGISLIVKENGKTADEETYTLANIEGMGQHCYFGSDGVAYDMNSEGLQFVINKAQKSFQLQPGVTGSRLKADFDGRFFSGYNGILGTYGLFLNNLNVGNVLIESQDGGSISGSYVPVAYEITSGWHKNHGGTFKVIETVRCSADWASYFVNVSDNSREQIYAPTTHNIELRMETTPEPELTVSKCEFNYYGILVDGTIKNDRLSDAVQSYNVYLISGKHNSAETEEFDSRLAEGHTKALLVAENLVPDDSGVVSFSKALPFNAALEKGWNPYEDNDGEMTVYLRYNLKAGSLEAENVPVKAPTIAYAFGSMVGRDRQISTGTSDIFVNKPSVTMSNGNINVTGAEKVIVCDTFGKIIYNGASGDINVGAGLYIIKADDLTEKIIVR